MKPLLGKEIASAEEMLGEARRDLAAGANEKAARTAVEVKSRALKIIAGAGVKNNANVVDTAGDVKIQKANRNTWESLRPNTGVGEGDFIKTGPNGTAEVLWNDGTMYRIRPETLFEVHGAAGSSGANVKLVVGTTDVNTGDKNKASVSTDAAMANIGTNASVGMDTDSQRTNVSSFAGSTTLTDKTGHSAVLGPRERAAASKEGGIGPKTVLPEAPVLGVPEDNLEIDFKKRDPLRLRWTSIKDATAYEVEIVEHIVEHVDRGRGVQGHARLLTEGFHPLDRAMEVRPCLRMHGNDVGAGLGERIEEIIDWRDHEMDVEGLFRMRAKRLHHAGADSQVRHEMPVHDIDVNPVGARFVDRAYFLAKLGEVGGEDRRRDKRASHRPISGHQPRRTSRAMKKPSSPPSASSRPGRIRTQPCEAGVTKSGRPVGASR